MRIIAEITEDMMGEVKDAKHRIKRAMDVKAEYPAISQREYEIAVQELAHADKDHVSVTELIAVVKKTKGEPPKGMMDYYNEKHEHYMKKYAEVKSMIDMYAKM